MKIKNLLNPRFRNVTTSFLNLIFLDQYYITSTIHQIKWGIKTYFEGFSSEDDTDIPPVVDIPIFRLGITDFGFRFKIGNKVDVTITLERPGLLIGKGQKTIDGLKRYLNKEHKYHVDIMIEQSNLWN